MGEWLAWIIQVLSGSDGIFREIILPIIIITSQDLFCSFNHTFLVYPCEAVKVTPNYYKSNSIKYPHFTCNIGYNRITPDRMVHGSMIYTVTLLGLLVLYGVAGSPLVEEQRGSRSRSRLSDQQHEDRFVDQRSKPLAQEHHENHEVFNNQNQREFTSSRHEECRGVTMLTDPEGLINSPRYPRHYTNNLNCRWLIEAPEGHLIQIEFPSGVLLEGLGVTGDRCDYDALDIYDGSNKQAPRLASLCGDRLLEDVTSTGQALFVHFHTDGSVTEEGFQFRYRLVEEDSSQTPAMCRGVTNLTDNSGTTTSQNYPQNYGHNSNCGFEIIAPEESVITVTFTAFSVEYEEACMYDAVSLYDGGSIDSSILDMYCGNDLPPQTTSTGNKMLIKLISDGSVARTGFSFDWEFKTADPGEKESPACSSTRPQILEREVGEFTTEGFSNGLSYRQNSKCSWRVIVPATMRAHLSFNAFLLEQSDLCRYDRVVLYDGYDNTADVMGRYCGDSTPGDITASGNVMYIEFISDESVQQPGFSVQFSGKEKKPGTGNGTDTENVECGIPSVGPKFGRIVGGQPAVPHSWPWQISMRYKNHPTRGDWGHYCGGSIIHPRWVVTAAHCVEGKVDPSLFRVLVGDHNRLETERSELSIDVADIIPFEDYGEGGSYNNDIALLRLTSDVHYMSEVSPVCLPEMDIPDRTLCVTTGWGNTKGTGDRDILQQVQVPTIARSECNQANWYRGKITNNMVCAGYPEGIKDSCQGDSGGPLVCTSGGPWKLYGITSWGFGCARAKRPGVYTRVTRYTDWIERTTGIQFL